jgi:phosphotransferase system HPr (HPr) family protein
MTPALAGPPILRQTFTLTNRNGLHARPCALLVRTLHPFACEVKVQHSDALASGNSVLA